MKKIPTLYKRVFDEVTHDKKDLLNELTPGLEWVIKGEGTATVKIDGTCCAIINGKYYKRYDAKKGKTPPSDGIPCGKADSITGHWPHWVPIKEDNPGDKWHIEGYKNTSKPLEDGTYELIGPHFRNNPYKLDNDILIKHGISIIDNCPRDYEGLKQFLNNCDYEGIVFWKDGQPQCKIKRSDFGYIWPTENAKYKL